MSKTKKLNWKQVIDLVIRILIAIGGGAAGGAATAVLGCL